MYGKTVLYILPLVHIVCCIFHDRPSIHIKPTAVSTQSQFGFSMAYQKNLRNLVVGAPTENIQGEVYSCDMKNLTRTTEVHCDKKIIDLDKLGVRYSRVSNPDQKFYMGASIAATSDYFFTCAPLTTMKVKKNESDVYGSCFEYTTNGTVYTYKAFEKGGIGWTTFIDETNDLLLIVKSVLGGWFRYTRKSKPLKTTILLKFDVSLYRNIGFAITPVKFFSKDTTVYAFSLLVKSNQAGGVAFLRYNPTNNRISVIENKPKHTLVIEEDSLGSMFGAALGASDLNRDGLEDLLIGAPAYSDDETVECGALHIYFGGDIESINKNRMRTIIGDKSGARFGSSIATQDIDGDDISEIIVGAPYEDDSGVVYVLSGLDVYETLTKIETYTMITINKLKLTQRIVRKDAGRFGFSLLFVSDFDENGCNELAVGSPKTAAVELFNCVQSVNVTMTNKLIGEATLRSDKIIVEVCARVEYPQKPNVVVGGLKVTNNIVWQGAYILKPDFSIDFSCKSCTNESFCENVTVAFNTNEGASYIFTTTAQITKSSPKREFNSSEVTIGPHSRLTRSINIPRHCRGDDCQPQLTMTLLWSNDSDSYVLGSSASETVTVRVKNDGNSSYESCVRVRVRGAATKIECMEDDADAGAGYLCYLRKPLRMFEEQSIQIILDMSKPTNLQAGEMVELEARLYEKCDQLDPTEELQKNITYLLSTNGVYLDEGTSYSRQVTDKDILDSKQFVFGIQEFLIKNTGCISWYNISAVVSMEKKAYIDSYNESSSKCEKTVTKDTVLFNCTMDLLPNKTQKVIVTQRINKTSIESNIIDNMLNITSQLTLYFQQTGEAKNVSVTSVLTVHRDMTLVNNKGFIILIAVILAALLIIILIIVLIKNGFFKRKQKERLEELRESVRRRSSRRTLSGPQDEPNGITDEGLQMDYDNDSAFEADGER